MKHIAKQCSSMCPGSIMEWPVFPFEIVHDEPGNVELRRRYPLAKAQLEHKSSKKDHAADEERCKDDIGFVVAPCPKRYDERSYCKDEKEDILVLGHPHGLNPC